MCQWLMTAALSELLNQVRVTSNCTESKVWLYVRLFVGTFLASPLFPCLRNVWSSSVTYARGCGHCSAKASRHHEFDCWYTCASVCLWTHWYLCFPLRAIFVGVQIQAKFEPASLIRNVVIFCFGFFVETNFVAKCTCKNFALKWLSCRPP